MLGKNFFAFTVKNENYMQNGFFFKCSNSVFKLHDLTAKKKYTTLQQKKNNMHIFFVHKLHFSSSCTI